MIAKSKCIGDTDNGLIMFTLLLTRKDARALFNFGSIKLSTLYSIAIYVDP